MKKGAMDKHEASDPNTARSTDAMASGPSSMKSGTIGRMSSSGTAASGARK